MAAKSRNITEIEEEMHKVWLQLRGIDVSGQKFEELSNEFNRLAERRFWALHQPGKGTNQA